MFISKRLKQTNFNIEDKYIKNLEKKILVLKLIEENENIFQMFSKVKNKDGFIDLLSQYMEMFKNECINVDEITLDDLELEIKFNEIIRLYKIYVKELNDKYIDNIDEYIKTNCVLLNGVNIYFDGYIKFNKSELKLIKYFVLAGASVHISLDTDISCIEDIYTNNTQDIFYSCNQTYLDFFNMSKEFGFNIVTNVLNQNLLNANNTIKYVANNIFSNDKKIVDNVDNCIHINVFSTVFDEVDNIANIICSKIQSGYKYSDIAIYSANIYSYKNIISRIFNQYNICLYIENGESIESCKLVLYIIQLLNISLNNMQMSSILDILKLGLNNINDNEIYELENYVKEFNIEKESLNDEFKYSNADKLNETRIKILDLFKDFMISAKFSALTIIESIYEHLNNNNILCKYYLNEKESKYNEDIWQSICNIFDSIYKIYLNNTLQLDEFLKIFQVAVKETKYKLNSKLLDQVELLNIDDSPKIAKKCVFFIGVNENNFPQKVGQDILFNDFELEKLNELNIKFTYTSIEKINTENFNIYKVLSNIKNELYITIPSTDFAGKTLRISNLVQLIKKTVDVKIIGNTQDCESLTNIYSKEKAFEYMLNNLQNENIEILYEYFKTKDKFLQILKYAKNDENLNQDTISLIYNDNFKTSISKLELFKKCPFSYYIQYILNIKPRLEYQISSMDIGSFMHNVLEKFSKYLESNSINWPQIIDIDNNLYDNFEEILYNIIDEQLDISLSKHKSSVKYGILKQKLIHTMTKVIPIIARGFNQSQFKPYGYELEFRENAIFAPIEIKLDNNKYMKLVGKIDRVDVLEIENKMYARVIDYKSSQRALELDDIKEGFSLQLITYLATFIENMQNEKQLVLPAAMLYFNLSDKLINLSEYTNNIDEIQNVIVEKMRMKGIFLKDIKILELMDNKINEKDRTIDVSTRSVFAISSKKTLDEEEFLKLCSEAKLILKSIGDEILNGVVKIRPNKKADYCKFCDFSSICRKNSNV